jgi:hypothetical protein
MRAPPLRTQITALVNHWRPIVGLETWTFDLYFGEKKLLGYCKADGRYEAAKIGFNLTRIRRELRTPVAVEELVVHELSHALDWRANETQVTRIARALLRAAGRNPSVVCSCG